MPINSSPTIKQQRAAKEIAEIIEGSKKTMTGQDLLEDVGYSKAIAKNPQMVFRSKGFKEAIEKLGFSLEAADLAVTKILHTGKEENRLRASDQIYKRLGGYSPEKRINIEVIITPKERAIAKKALDSILNEDTTDKKLETQG